MKTVILGKRLSSTNIKTELLLCAKFVRFKKKGGGLHRSMLAKERYLALIIQTASFIVGKYCNCAVVASLILEKYQTRPSILMGNFENRFVKM